MSYFIQIHRGINKIRFLTLPLVRKVHWHTCPDQKRRPINCSQHSCPLCADANLTSNLYACVAYDYSQQGVVELLSGIHSGFAQITKDPRLYDFKVNVIEHMRKYEFNIISNKLAPIKPNNDMLLEIANKVVPYTSDLAREELYSIDPGFVQSVITQASHHAYQNAIDGALNILSTNKVKVMSYEKDIWSSTTRLELPNRAHIVLTIMAARRLPSGELFSHATGRVLEGRGFTKPRRPPAASFSFGANNFGMTMTARATSDVILLVHEDGDFKFVPEIETILNEAKLEGLLT